jgi:hypothetical protein
MAATAFKHQSLQDVQQEMGAWLNGQIPLVRRIPINAQPFTVIGAVEAPPYGIGNLVQVATYTAGSNWAALFTHIVLGYAGPAPAPLPGDINWAVTIDRAFGNEGYYEKDYGNITMPLGDFRLGHLWPVLWRHRDTEAIRVVAYTNQNVVTGPGAFITAALIGYEWPEALTD